MPLSFIRPTTLLWATAIANLLLCAVCADTWWRALPPALLTLAGVFVTARLLAGAAG